MFQHFSIRFQLITLFGLLSLLLLAVGGLGLFNLQITNEAVHGVYEHRLVPLGELDMVARLLTRNQLDVTLGLTGDPATASKEMDGVQQNIARIEQIWNSYRAGQLTPEEAALADRFHAASRQFVEQGLKPGIVAIRAQDQMRATEIVHARLVPLFEPVRASMNALMQLQTEMGKREYLDAQARYRHVRNVLIGATVSGMLLATAVALWIIRAITLPLSQAVRLAQSVAAGDLTHTIEVDAMNETGQLLVALGEMTRGLSHIVSQVRTGTESMATTSVQIAGGNQDLSMRTEQQAGALEETVSSMEQLTATVQQNAVNAQLANELALSASQTASRGGQVVAEVVQTMGAINASSNKIVDIIAVIDSIAFQTNILALNAAVEAARAGEQGRGFAVVASEVRNLAQRSAGAAREIKLLIHDSVLQVETGSVLVDRAGATMNEVLASVDKVTSIMQEISVASGAQHAGIAQIGQAIGQMDQMTQQNAALVEQAAAAAEAMRQQADELAQVVRTFRLETGGQAEPHLRALSAGPAGTLPGTAARARPVRQIRA
jgi:methyl-accepting chemotaxis protein